MVKPDSTLRRIEFAVAAVVFFAGTVVPVVVFPSPPAYSDTAHNLLSLRACTELKDCFSSVNELGFGGLWYGILWNRFLSFVLVLKLSWSGIFALISATNAAIAALFYLRQRRSAERFPSLLGAAAVVTGSLEMAAAPVLWNATLVPPLASLCTLFLIEALEQKRTHWFVASWMFFALLVDVHPVGSLLFPMLLVTLLLRAPKPAATLAFCVLGTLGLNAAVSPAAAFHNGAVLASHWPVVLLVLGVSWALGSTLREKVNTLSISRWQWIVAIAGFFSTYLLPIILTRLLDHPMSTRYQGASIGFTALLMTQIVQYGGSWLAKQPRAMLRYARYGIVGFFSLHVLGPLLWRFGHGSSELSDVWRMDDAVHLSRAFQGQNLRYSDVHRALRTPFPFYLLASIGASMPFHDGSSSRESPKEQIILLPHSFLVKIPPDWSQLPLGGTPASWIRMPSTINLVQSRVCLTSQDVQSSHCEVLTSELLQQAFAFEDSTYVARSTPALPGLDKRFSLTTSASFQTIQLKMELHMERLRTMRSFVLLPDSVPWEIVAVQENGVRRVVHSRCVVLLANDGPSVLELEATISPEGRQSVHVGIPALIDFDAEDAAIAPFLDPRNWAGPWALPFANETCTVQR